MERLPKRNKKIGKVKARLAIKQDQLYAACSYTNTFKSNQMKRVFNVCHTIWCQRQWVIYLLDCCCYYLWYVGIFNVCHTISCKCQWVIYLLDCYCYYLWYVGIFNVCHTISCKCQWVIYLLDCYHYLLSLICR